MRIMKDIKMGEVNPRIYELNKVLVEWCKIPAKWNKNLPQS